MADLTTAPVPGTDGQAAAAPAPTGTTNAAAPAATDGQGAVAASSDNGQAASAAPASQQDEPTFFDPKTLPPELMPGYKQMHAAFTRAMQGISSDKDLVRQAKQFLADPVAGMQAMAKQHGFVLTRAQAGAALDQQQNGQPQDWAPQTWDDVLTKAEERAANRILKELAPVLGNVKKMHEASIQRQLDEIDPQWRVYEDAMIENMRAHPTLVNDPEKLYRLSVPQNAIEERATAAALARMNRSASAARTSGTSATRSTPAPREVRSFSDAEKAAREELQGKS